MVAVSCASFLAKNVWHPCVPHTLRLETFKIVVLERYHLSEVTPTCHRFIFVLDGTVNFTVPSAKADKVLHADEYAYVPADTHHSLASDSGAGLLLFERHCIISGKHRSQYRICYAAGLHFSWTQDLHWCWEHQADLPPCLQGTHRKSKVVR